MMGSMFSGNSFGSSPSIDNIQKQLEEDDFKTTEENTNNEKVYVLPE